MTIVVTPIPSTIELAAPDFVLGSANSAGAAITAVSSNSTLLAFDGEVPTTIEYSAVPAAGGAVVTARRDHTHGMTVAPASAASEAEMEAATSITVWAPPGRLQDHPGVLKGWAMFDMTGTPSLTKTYNVAAMNRFATGKVTIEWATDMPSADYPYWGLSGGNAFVCSAVTATAGTISVQIRTDAGTPTDEARNYVAAAGGV